MIGNIFRPEASSIKHFINCISSNTKLGMEALNEFLEFGDVIHKENGVVTFVKVFKEINNRSRHYVAGHPKGDYTYGNLWIKIDKKSKLPKRLVKLRRFLDIEPQVALAIPNMIYMVRLKPDNDITTIIEESSVPVELHEEFKHFCNKNVPKLVPSEIPVLITTKAGPQGPAFCSQAKDMVSILLATWPFGGFDKIIEITNGRNWLYDCFNNFKEVTLERAQEIKFESFPILAKLVFLSAPAGKTRLVYVLNWWVQMVLLPLHDSMMELFRTIGNDCTWNQDNGVEVIKTWSQQGRKLYSFDLTAATDRWPIEHQLIVIESAFGKEIGEVWCYLMKHIPPYIKSLGRHVHYSVGQPMGAYSSWAALNLSHHMVMRYLMYKLDLRQKDLYMVLGDDIVICHEVLAREYEIYMTKTLGVKINKRKSIVHEEGKPHSAEFARHIIRDGSNVGTLSPNLLKEIFKDRQWWKQLELVRELSNKFSLAILVDKDKILVPSQVDKLLINKDDFLLIIGIPTELQKLSRIYTDDADSVKVEGVEYKIYSNPYAGLPEGEFDTIVEGKLRSRAVARLNDLTELDNRLSGSPYPIENSPLPGHLLDSEHHPIRVMLRNLKDDLVKAWYNTTDPSNKTQVLSITTQASDLLIDVLGKGKSFEDWKDNKNKRQKEISLFYKESYPEVLDLIEFYRKYPPNSTQTDWNKLGDASWV